MKSTTLRKQIMTEFYREAENEGITLSREQRRALKKIEKHQPRINRAKPTAGLSILAKRYVNGTPMEDEKRERLVFDYYSALTAMTSGYATAAHADILTYAVNIGYLLTMIDAGLGKQHRTSLIKPALLALHRMNDRNKRLGKYGLDAEGLQALRDFAPLHESQLELASVGEIEAAIKKMHEGVATKAMFSFEDAEEEVCAM